MTSFWRTMIDVGGEKIGELGTVGTVLGLLWIVGLWVLYDLMDGAFREGFAQAGTTWLGLLVVWLLVGAAVYLYFDPHGVRTSRNN